MKLTGELLTLSVLLQTFESFFIAAWPWACVRRELPRAMHGLVRSERLLLFARFEAALVSLFHPSWPSVFWMVLTTWLINVRWRGTFNGGADQLTFFALLIWLISLIRPEFEARAALTLALWVMLAYVVAGVAKWREPGWRKGHALAEFLPEFHRVPALLRKLLAWSVIAFEVSCPLFLLRPDTGLVWLGAGVLFHLINAYTLGLNRFFYAFVATYPALYWASHLMFSR